MKIILLALGFFFFGISSSLTGLNSVVAGEESEALPFVITEPDFPSSPSNLIAEVADGMVDISFDLQDDGGSPILNYEYSLDGGQWIAFDPVFLSSPVSIRELEDGRDASRAMNEGSVEEASEAAISFISTEDCFAGQYWTGLEAPDKNNWRSVAYGNNMFVAVASFDSFTGTKSVMTSLDGVDWTAHATNFSSRAITFGDGKFVTFPDFSNQVAVSVDGREWTFYEIQSFANWNSATYGNGIFVAVDGFTNAVMTSTNGINWTTSITPTQGWESVTFGNGRFVAVAKYSSGTKLMSSIDGINWTAYESPLTNNLGAVAFGDGKFVAPGRFSSNLVMLSADGVEWESYQLPETHGWAAITFGLGRFVAVGGDKVMSSTNGISWSTYKSVESNSWSSIAYGDGKFVAVSSGGTNQIMISDCSIPSANLTAPLNLLAFPNDSSVEIIFSSPYDGVSPITNYEYSLDGGSTWDAFNPAVSTSPVNITNLSNDQEYQIGLRAVNIEGPGKESVFLSVTPETCFPGQTWTAHQSVGQDSWSSITFGADKFVAVAQNRLMSSMDGIKWTAHSVPEANNWRSVTYGNGKFIAVAASGANRVMSSPDGINWTAHNIPGDTFWNSVTFGDGKFVAVGSSGTDRVMSSSDGINWSFHQFSEFSGWRSVTYGNGRFVAVGNFESMTSIDGINWTTANTPRQAISITYGAGKFVAVSGDPERRDMVLSSTDGVNWSIQLAAAPGIWSAVAFGGGRFVAVSRNMIMTSKDAINWSAHKVPASLDWNSIAFGNGKFVSIAGFSNRVMVSECTPPPTVPDAPTDLMASVADGLADISFIQGSDGGSPILNYQYSLDGGAWTPFESSPLMLRGLNNGTTYSIAVRAVNAVGVGEASEAISFTPTEDCFAGQYWTAYAATESNFWRSSTYGNGKFVAVSSDGQNRVMSSSDGMNWIRSGNIELNTWNSIAYGNGKFVAVSRNGINRVMVSEDGVNWIPGIGPNINTGIWNSVTYGNGRFVAVGMGTGNERIISSTDGVNWTAHQSPEEISLYSVIYGDGKYVAVASSGSNRVLVSPDGINWTGHQAAAESFWFSVTYGNGRFVAVALSGEVQVMSSIDGTSWTAHEVPESTSWSSVTYGLGRFVAVLQNGINNDNKRVMSSLNGIDWTVYKAAEPNSWFNVSYGGGKFVALAYSGANRVMVSDCTIPSAELNAPTQLSALPLDKAIEIQFIAPYDGVTPIINYEYSINGADWVAFDPVKKTSPVLITGLNNGTEYSITLRAIGAEGPGAASMPVSAIPEACLEGKFWNARSVQSNSEWVSVTYGNGKFVAVADIGSVRSMSSIDGEEWSLNEVPEPNSWNSVTYGNGKFVAVASSGTNRVMSSTDGINWTAHPAAEANAWTSVTYSNGRFVAVASSGDNRVMSSTDGTNWTANLAAEANAWRSVSYGNGRFVAVASTGVNRVMSSTDGINWTAHPAAENNFWFSITYGNGRFVAVAQGSPRVMSSPDGINWTAHQVAEANNWTSVTFGNGRFVAVAQNGTNRVMSSADGSNWVSHKAAESNPWYSVTFGNNKFVAVAWSGANKVMISECPKSLTLLNQSGTFNTDASRVITLADLSADDTEIPADQLVFTIKSLPASGTLNFDGSAAGIGQTFTQADIAAGKLSYQNTVNTSRTDSFTFTVAYLSSTQTAEETFAITMNDVTPPVAIAQNVTVILGANGQGSTTAALVNAGSSDNFTAPENLLLTLSRTNFNCSDIGNTPTVTLTVTDENGNSATATALVTVLDETAPTLSLSNNIRLDLNANGMATLTASELDRSSKDNCGIASFTISQSEFTCEDLGIVEVTVTATDLSGNVASGIALVTVRDRANPVFVDLPKSISVTLPEGDPYVIPDFREFVTDNCGIAAYTQSIEAGTVTTTAGTYNVAINVSDASGNTAKAKVRIVRSAPRVRRNAARMNFENSELVTVAWNTPFEEVISGLEWEDKLAISWIEDGYDHLTPGLYQVEPLLTTEIQARFSSPPVLNILVLDKPKALDIELSSKSISDKLKAGDQIALFSTIDPVDDIHTYSVDGDPNLSVEGNKLIWKGSELPAAQMKITVFSTDRAGQTISKEVTLFRELRIGEFLIYPNPAEEVTNVLVELDQPAMIVLRIFDASGKLVIEDQFSKEQTFVQTVSLKGLSTGMYTVQIQAGKMVMTGRLIKK